MPRPTIQEIANTMAFFHYKDVIRLTQGFGVGQERYGSQGHNGIDIGETDRSRGDKLYAPFDGKVFAANNWAGWNIGWETYIQSDPVTVNGTRFVIRLGYTHTRGKCLFKKGDRIKRGDVVDTSGGTFTLNSFWTGPHTHVTVAPRYDNNLIDQDSWQPDWNNGHTGFVNPMTFLEIKYSIADLEGKLVKSTDNPRVYLVENGKLMWFPDETVLWSYGYLLTDVQVISTSIITQIPYGGEKKLNTGNLPRLVKEIYGIVINNPTRAKEQNTKYFS